MQELSEDRLAELEAMAKAADKGVARARALLFGGEVLVLTQEERKLSSQFHIHSQTIALSLVAEVRRLRADRAKLWDALHALQDGLQCSCLGTDHRCGSCRVLDRARTVLAETEGSDAR